MAARFPDDPAPRLELATLHYSRNAYRRAEDALAEARERAPHDERILDLQAVGFLKSADRSRKNGRLPLGGPGPGTGRDHGAFVGLARAPGEAPHAGGGNGFPLSAPVFANKCFRGHMLRGNDGRLESNASR